MTEQELREKIVEVISQKQTYGITEEFKTEDLGHGGWQAWTETTKVNNAEIADALIAAGIGDLKEHRIFAGKDGSIKQLYSGEEVEKIVKERKELKDELRSKVEYIHEQDEVIKGYKHRAQVAENELKLYKLAVKIWQERYSDIRCFNFNIALRQAEKELAEEEKE